MSYGVGWSDSPGVDCAAGICMVSGRAVSSYQPGRVQASSALLRKPDSSLQIPAEQLRCDLPVMAGTCSAIQFNVITVGTDRT